MELSIQERLKDLRVERGLTLEQLAEQTHLSKSALGSYEGDNFKVSHQPGEVRVRRQLTQEGIIHPPAFQQFNHIITQMQVCKIGVWVISCLG